MEKRYGVNFKITETEQAALVNLCNSLKVQLQNNAQAKHQNMWQAYSYFKGEFVGGDLLPAPGVNLGAENDAKTGRPQIFIPLTRTQVKMLYSQLALSIFPNEDEFFRVIAKSQEGGDYEETLTRGLAWLIKNGNITEKIKKSLLDACWAGNMSGYPRIRVKKSNEWIEAPDSPGEFEQIPVVEGYELDYEQWNPLNFYPDPFAENAETSRWLFCCRKKVQDLLDAPRGHYINLDKLKTLGNNRASATQDREKRFDTATVNYLQTDFLDVQPYCDYDLYYFPLITIEGRDFRNMMVGVVDGQVLVRFSPNMTSKGMNPAVFSNWLPDADTPYGTGPVEDIKDIQKLINIIWNHAIESAARNGNRWAMRDDVDSSSLFGAAGGIVTTSDDPRASIMPLSGNMSEIDTLINAAGVLKAEAQAVAGSQHPFQGSSNIDFKKTATELQIIQENAMSILREVIEHITLTFIQPIMERYLFMAADVIDGPLSIRVDDKTTGTQYIKVDFSVVKQFPFTVEITSVNLAQSKMAMVNSISRFLEMAQANPALFAQLRDGGYHVVKLLADLMGIKYADKIMYTPQEMQMIQQQQITSQMQMQAMLQGGGMPGPLPQPV